MCMTKPISSRAFVGRNQRTTHAEPGTPLSALTLATFIVSHAGSIEVVVATARASVRIFSKREGHLLVGRWAFRT